MKTLNLFLLSILFATSVFAQTADEAAAKADGKVTHSERTKLQHEANKDSKAIHRQKHNKQTAST